MLYRASGMDATIALTIIDVAFKPTTIYKQKVSYPSTSVVTFTPETCAVPCQRTLLGGSGNALYLQDSEGTEVLGGACISAIEGLEHRLMRRFTSSHDLITRIRLFAVASS